MSRGVPSRAGLLLLALAALVCLQPAGPLALRVVAIAAVWLIAPGLLLARRIVRGSPAARAMFGVGWSPFLAGGLTALLAVSGVPLPAAARIVSAVVGVAALLEAVLPAPEREARRWPLAPWLVAITGCLLVLGLHALRPALAQRSDGAFHAAVTLSVLRTGVPPEDPFFAGLRLLYFWGTHVWCAAWLALAPGLSPWTPFVALMGGATFVALAAIALLAGRLGAGTPVTVFAAALAMFGTSPFSWFWVVARMASGEVRGLEEARRLLSRGVDPALTVLGTGLLHPSLVLPADKFIVITPFALGVGLAVALVLAMLDLVERPGWRASAVLASTAAAALFVHPVAAVAILASGSLAWLIVVDRALAHEPRARQAATGSALAVLAACVIALPYLLAIESGPYEPGPLSGAPALGARALWSLLLSGATVLAIGGWWLARMCETAAERRVLLATAAILGTGVLFFEMRGDNQSKLLNLLLFVMSPAAAMGWRELARRAPAGSRWAVPAILITAIVPTLLCCAWAYSTEGTRSADAPQDPGPAGRSLLAGLARRAPPNAVLVDGTLDSTVHVASLSPRLSGRPLLWGGPYMAGKWAYSRAALGARQIAARELASPSDTLPMADSLLRALGREAWVLRRAEPEVPESLPPGMEEVAREGDYALYRYEPVAK